MPHESSQIPLDAGMWLDDLSPPPAALASARHSTASLEESLQHVAHAFDDADHDVHTLFPMLSETSFDYEDEGATQHDLKADSAAAFPDDLSPILTAMPSPRTPKAPSAAKSPTPSATTSLPLRNKASSAPNEPASAGIAIPFPDDDFTKAVATPTPVNRMRRRRLRSTTLSTALTQWTHHEQNVFFLVFKPKWSIVTPTPEQFATLLLERFDAVSEKLTKTSHDAEAFYITMLQAITDLLDVMSPHDIDLLNPDEIRIALWCWHKLLDDSHKRDEMEQIDDATDEQKRPLAQELLQSIVRSRRQMRKAKSAVVVDEADEVPSLEGLLREALEHSSLPSYLYQLAPVEANATPVVHHPVVRKKKHSKQQPVQPLSVSGQKRPRSQSVELYHAFTNGTPLPLLASNGEHSSQRSFVTPTVGNASKKHKHDSLSQTPQQTSGKKIYIKLRMVPRDTQTKTVVERCGCNPKVELKLSSTKKVSDVLDHMTKKWAKVGSLVDAQATLHFFQKDTTVMSPELVPLATPAKAVDGVIKSWSRRNQNVTCLDVWRQSGKMKNDEYIAEVSYQWCVETKDAVEGEDLSGAWAVDDPTQLLDLLDREMAHTRTTKKHLAFDQDECSSSREASPFASPLNLNDPPTAPFDQEQTAQAQSLQAFSETVAFDTKSFAETDHTEEQLSLASLPDDALSELLEMSPNSQLAHRRRITPVLVATDECEI